MKAWLSNSVYQLAAPSSLIILDQKVEINMLYFQKPSHSVLCLPGGQNISKIPQPPKRVPLIGKQISNHICQWR